MGFKSFRTFALTYIMQVKPLVKLLFALRPGGFWLLSSSSSTEAPCFTSPEVDLQALTPCLGAWRRRRQERRDENCAENRPSYEFTPLAGIAPMGRQMARAYWESPTRTQRCVMAFWPN